MTAQVVTITDDSQSYKYAAPLLKIKWAWVTDSANGAIVDSTTAGEVNKTSVKYSGVIERLITNPAASTADPTDNYDVTILDDDGYDVLMGGGLNRDTANTEQVLASSLGCCLNTYLRLNVGTAGNSKGGEVILYIRP